METKLLDMKGKEVGKIELPEKAFKVVPNASFLHEVTTAFLANPTTSLRIVPCSSMSEIILLPLLSPPESIVRGEGGRVFDQTEQQIKVKMSAIRAKSLVQSDLNLLPCNELISPVFCFF